MRILYCNKYNFNFSGTESYLFELMDLMRHRGHETALFSMADPRGEPSPFDRHFVPFIDFKSGSNSPFSNVRNAVHAIYSVEARRKLRRMIAEFRPDVAHVRNIYHHLTPSILWELEAQRVPVLYHLNDFKLICPSYNLVSHGRVCERCQGGKFRHVLTEGCYSGPRGSAFVLAAEAYAHRWLRTYQKCVDCFLAPSQFVKSKLTENGWDAGKIEVLPHFQTLPADLPAPVGEDAPILYFGRLSPEKGIYDLLLAMQSVPSVPLQIAGDGPQRSQLEETARSRGSNNVQFLGHLQGNALQYAIDSARFTVLPSRAYETLGKTILESYSRGRAVVASDLGSRRELVHDGVTGLLFPPGDVAGLARVIRHLVEHPQQAEAMGWCGRELVRERHSADSHYHALCQLYERLCQSTTPSRPQLVRPTTPKLRVAFIGGRGVVSKYSGIETYYEEAGARLADLGYEITVYCRSYFTPALKQYRGMQLVRLPTIRSKHLETPVHTFLSTIHTLFRGHDIVHYHALGPALFSFIPRLFGGKTIVTVQGLDWQRRKWGWLAAAVLRKGEQAAVRFPNATTVVSRTLQQHYRSRHGAETIYVPNGTNLIDRGGVIHFAQPGLLPDPYILFLGRFSPEKNCHLLIAAYEQLETSVQLVLAGGSSYPDAYSRDLHRHASSRIRLLDWVSGKDREQLLVNAMLLVLPSDLEGLSLSLLEAMGAGVCVLASDIPENCELIDGAGFTFHHGNVDDLERMLRLLIDNPSARKSAARRARAMVRNRYLWSHVVGQIDQTYKALAGHGMEVSAVRAPRAPLESKLDRKNPAA
jgi:glycosyltransferase involved in cell wall biosynthesis